MTKRLPHAIEQLRGSYRLPKKDFRTLRQDLCKVGQRDRILGCQKTVRRGVLYIHSSEELQAKIFAWRFIKFMESRPNFGKLLAKLNPDLAT